MIQRTSREHRRLALTLLLSLLIHAMLMSLTFGGEEFGFPGLHFPWQDRRIEVPNLRAVLVPARVTPAAPAVKSAAGRPQRASIESPVAGKPTPTPNASSATQPHETAVAETPLVAK